METPRDYLIWLGETEFAGKSMNGPSLIETLRSISVDEALSTDTYEGYSAWGVALHVLFFKFKVGQALGAEMPDYAHDENGWPSLPEDTSQSSYEAMIEELVAFHNGLMTAAKAADDSKLAEPMPGWNMPIGKAFAWLVAHDTNHNTQIRNMGLESLKEK